MKAEFVEALGDWTRITEEEKRAAAGFHQATCFWLSFAADGYREIQDGLVPVGIPAPADPLVQVAQRRLWTFLQSAKSMLDSLGREINLVYWGLDDEKRFFNPLVQMRWTTFYTVREKVLLYDEFRDDPLGRLLRARSRSETAERVYLELSHLMNISMIGPPVIGRVDPSGSVQEAVVKVSEAKVWLPDDPRRLPFTFARGFEVNRLFKEALDWLEILAADVYDTLHTKLRSEG
jgi:hypothetical protein